jgi:UrcA family protein
MRHLMNSKTAVPGALLAILLGSLSACADVHAAPADYEVATRTVKYGDLDLAGSAGAATLYLRIQNAARAVCEPAISSRAWESIRLTQRCAEQSIARAVADVNAPALTSYYVSKTRRPITLARRQ